MRNNSNPVWVSWRKLISMRDSRNAWSETCKYHSNLPKPTQGNERKKDMLTKLAVRWLVKQLKKDKGLWYAYQSNIAMTIYDNVKRYFPLTTEKHSPTLHEFCNICANDFLKLLTSQRKD